MKIAVANVVFREDLYPRIETSAVTVQKYAEDLDVLPPIKVNQRNELIDGWHRWTAHKKNGIEMIEADVIETKSDAELLEKAIETNATHGLQLSQSDKRDMARKIYHSTPEKERDEKKKHLAVILSVSERTIRDWLSRVDKDSKEARNKRIFDMWLACYTGVEIAEANDLSEKEIGKIVSDLSAELPKGQKADSEHATDFTPPIYNIWKQQEKTNGSSHFGNSEVRWVDNLLYLYTKPFDMVLDPFAGGGSTIDVCKRRFRRYMVSDRKPIVEREKEIRKHDLKDGVLKPPQWKDVKLVYLDPPYWIQAEGQYSNDADDLGNQSLEDFTKNLARIINEYAKKISDAYIALIIQPTQWKAPERQFTDHVGDMLRLVKLPVDMRYSVPYESQQCTAQMVEWSKENKRCLVLSREIVVWRVA
jgi:DNA modification methylase